MASNSPRPSKVQFLFILLLILCLISTVLSAKIIIIIGNSSKSHKNVLYPIAGELLKRGHEVTMYSVHIPHQILPGLKEEYLQEVEKEFLKNMPELFDENGPRFTRRFMYDQAYYDLNLCRHFLKSPPIQSLLKEEQSVDLAILSTIFTECHLPLAAKVAKSTIYVSPGELHPNVAWNLNIPNPSYVPSSYFATTNIKMNFFDRIRNSASNLAWILYRNYVTVPRMDRVVQEIIPGAMSIREAETKIELVLVNRHHVVDYNVPSLPFVQEIGGITVHPSKPLPKDLEEFVSRSGKEGFIFVSFGTMAPDEKFPPEVKRMFIEAFSLIPQRVLWKFSVPIENLPGNVLRRDWFPQNDVLGHPKCAAFLTHGGHFGLMETVFHAVPIVGLPVLTDQPANLLRSEDKLFGIKLDWSDITTEKLVHALNTVVNDTRYKESLIRHQTLFKDNPISPQDKAAYWIEHILRHGGSQHLRAEGADSMNFLQYFMLDIIVFVLLIFVISCFIVVKFSNLLFGKRKRKC